MKFAFVVIVFLLSIALLGVAMAIQKPKTETVFDTISHLVAEQRTKTVIKKITVDGKEIEVPFDYTYSVYAPVYEMKERIVEPTNAEKIAYWIGVGCVAFVFLVCGTIWIAWARDILSKAKSNEKSKRIDKMMNTMISFSVGICVGVAGAGGLTAKKEAT